MEEEKPNSPKEEEEAKVGGGGGGWGGWGFSSFSVLTDLQKAASIAAEEISRNVVSVAKNAAKGISDLQVEASDSESAEEDAVSENPPPEVKIEEGDDDRIRKSALTRLEKASEDSLLGWVTGFRTVAHLLANRICHQEVRLEHSAANLADSIQHGNLPINAGSLAPSILETRKTFTTKGMQVLERVGKETMELLILETGLEVEKDPREIDQQTDEEQFEEVTFDRCFYIYGGTGGLSNHYALLFNRRKTKLLSDQKSLYDDKLRQVQQIFHLGVEFEESVDPDKGKNVETTEEDNGNELKILHDSSVSKVADMAAGFTATLGGLATNEIIQRTTDRLETIHSEGVHIGMKGKAGFMKPSQWDTELADIFLYVFKQLVSQLLMLWKSVISNANKSQIEDGENDDVKIDYPEDSVSKAKIIRFKAQSMTGDVEVVSNSFITGISDIIEAYLATTQGASPDAHDGFVQPTSIQEKAHAISDHLRAGRTTALDKIQDALQYLAYVVLSTSMPTA